MTAADSAAGSNIRDSLASQGRRTKSRTRQFAFHPNGYGLECKGGGEETIAYEKIEVVPVITVTSTCTNNEDNREFHTWRAWGSRVRKKQLDNVMGPKDLRSTTWYLNRARFRTWDHFLAITKVEGRDFKTKRRVKGWVGWAPVSEVEKAKFHDLVLCLRSDHNEDDPRGTDERDGLVHDRLVRAAAEIKKLPRPHQGTGTNIVCLKSLTQNCPEGTTRI